PEDMGWQHFQGQMTPSLCDFLCIGADWNYAGVQWYGECFCGQTIAYEQRPDSECNTPCNGDPSKMCGGAWRNSIYLTGAGANNGEGGGAPTPQLSPGGTL